MLDERGRIWYNEVMFGKKISGRTKNSRGKVQKSMKKVATRNLSDYAEVAADEQQQNKIVLYFLNGQKLEAVPEGKAEVSPEQKQKVIDSLASGKIKDAEIEKFLLQVMMPLQDAETNARSIFQKIVEMPKQRQILAVATGHDANNWRTVNEADLRNLLEKPLKGQADYRTPVGFAEFREKFLEGIEEQATPEQMQEYNRAMNGLEEKIYGRRFDYYRQIELLRSQGKGTVETVATEVEAEPAEEVTGTAKVDDLKEAVQEVPKVGLFPLSAERGAEILGATVIVGDVWRQDGNEYALNVNSLVNGGLNPAYEAELDGVKIALSFPFQLSDGRGAVLGYVLADGVWKLRSYYLDPRTGLWHFAPDIIRGARGEGMGQITEGYGEASTMLPVVLQQYLTELVKVNGFREITTVNADFLFAGSCAAYDSLQEYREALARGQMKSDFYREVEVNPMSSNWQASGKNKNVPQLLSVNAEMAPNFQNLVASFQTYSILAGQLKVEAFASHDRQEIWIFCSDDWHRTAIGNIEVNSAITSTGCRRAWMQAGDMVTPLYEYSTQAGNYGDPSDTRKGMVGMWNQYLSKIPVIVSYLNR